MPEAHRLVPFARWLDAVADDIGVNSRRRRRFLIELEGHLTDSAERLAQSGLDRGEAERQALAGMGSPAAVAEAFRHEATAPSAVTRFVGLLLVATGVLTVVNLFRPVPGVVDDALGSVGVIGLYFRQRYRLRSWGRTAFRVLYRPALSLPFSLGTLWLLNRLGASWFGMELHVVLAGMVLVLAYEFRRRPDIMCLLVPVAVGLLAYRPDPPLVYFLSTGRLPGPDYSRTIMLLALSLGSVVAYLVYLVATVRARVLPPLPLLAAHLTFFAGAGNPIKVAIVVLLAVGTTWLGLWLCCERAPVHRELALGPGGSG